MFQTFLRQGVFVVVAALLMSACTGAESRKASFVSQGEQHMAAHDWQKARLDFRNALQIDPKDQKLQFLAAQAAEHAGEYGEAADRYRSLLQQDKNNVAARAALGRLYAGGGIPAEAIKLAEEGLATHPDDPSLLTVRGVARAMRGDTAGAMQDAQAAVARAPTDADTAALMASLYQLQGRNDEALVVLQRASAASPDNVALRIVLAQALAGANRGGEAEKELLEVVKIEPRELKHRYRLAQFYVMQKNVDAAEKTLRAAVTTAPDDVEPKLALANLIASQRSFETGEKSLRELVASDPKNLVLQLGLGQFCETHQRPALAEDVYRKVVAAGGANAQALAARNRLAALALEANRSADASALIDEVLKASPRDNEALTMRASVALARGDTTSAIADLRAVLRDQPNAPGLMRALAAAYAANRDVGLAEETLRTAMRANPNDMQTRLALADLLMKNGRGEEAKPLAEQIVSDQPGDVRAIEAAFRIQVARRDLVGARASSAAIQTLRPDLPTGYYLAGLVDEAEGKRADALGAFERAIAVAPTALEPVAAAVRIDLAEQHGERAVARVNDAITRSPKGAALLDLKGELLLQLRRYDEAAAALSDAVTVAPGWWVPYRDLALAEMARGRSEAAVAVYQRGIEATQFSPPLITQLGSLYERLNRADAAIALYEAWLKRDPGSEIAANNCAMLLVTYRTRDASSMARAVKMSEGLQKSTQPQYIDTYAWVRYLRGDFGAAVEALERAVAALPDDPQIRAHLGLAQYRAGKVDASRLNLERVADKLEGLPEAADVRTALQELDRLKSK